MTQVRLLHGLNCLSGVSTDHLAAPLVQGAARWLTWPMYNQMSPRLTGTCLGTSGKGINHLSEGIKQLSRTLGDRNCSGLHHRLRGKTTTGSALDGAVFDITEILAYLVHNMSRSQVYLGFGHFG